MDTQFDFDYIIIGSGFGGSVSAMRLSQKGYRVLVIESGKHFKHTDFPKTNWNLKKYLWAPKLSLYGIQRIHLLGHTMVLSGAGVGGGSLVYANTLYVPPDPFFNSEAIKMLGGKETLAPYFKLAQKMLGVRENPHLTPVDSLMLETSKKFNAQDSFKRVPVGVYFGDAGNFENKVTENIDPYFSGEGPSRSPCNLCGGCIVGCRFNAKNTLDKNYLYFAQTLKAEILAEHKVTDIIPLTPDGQIGYKIIAEKTTSFLNKETKKFTTKNLVVAAGVLGTNELLLKMKMSGRLPKISDKIGYSVRTNSEAIVGVTKAKKNIDYSKGIAITSSLQLDPVTHIESVRYSKGSDFMGVLATLLTDGGGYLPRPLKYIINILFHPIQFLKTFLPFGFAKSSILLLVMQTLDNSINLIYKRKWYWPFRRSLTSASAKYNKIPTYIPLANEFAKHLALKTEGIPQSSVPEVLLNIPTTAHILGGCIIGKNSNEGVIDSRHRLFGYENIMVCDGSVVPVNLGVNPSLTIVALTERAMAFVPSVKPMHKFQFEEQWQIVSLLEVDYTKNRQ